MRNPISSSNSYKISCFLVHPCDKQDNGGCEQECEKDGGNAKCACQEGFKLNEDGQTCEKSKFFISKERSLESLNCRDLNFI